MIKSYYINQQNTGNNQDKIGDINNKLQAANNYLDGEAGKEIRKELESYLLEMIGKGKAEEVGASFGLTYNAKFQEAIKLIQNLDRSTDPWGDYEKVQNIIKDIVNSMSNSQLQEGIELQNLKSTGITITASDLQKEGHLFGYNNKDTYGKDNKVRLNYTIDKTNGTITWTDSHAAEDIIPAVDSARDLAHKAAKSKLGNRYNKESVDNCFDMALISALENITDYNKLYTVDEFIDSVLKYFSAALTTEIRTGLSSSQILLSNDTSIFDGLGGTEEVGYGKSLYGDNTVSGKAGNYTSAKIPVASSYAQMIEQMYERIVTKCKGLFGSRFDEQKLKELFNKAQCNAARTFANDINTIGSDFHWKRSLNDWKQQIALELDVLLLTKPPVKD